MKLRNKKTGEIVTISSLIMDAFSLTKNGDIRLGFGTLAELAENWEDYKSDEPLIKNEKIRKAIRVWRACNDDDCFYIIDDKRLTDGSGMVIEFKEEPFAELERRHYTISELCGEEENA